MQDDQDRGDEGRTVIVESVEIRGGRHLSESGMMKLLTKLQEPGRFSRSNWPDEAGEDARQAWQEEGYFTVVVHTKAQPESRDESRNHYSLIIEINEGAQYRLKGIRFENMYHPGEIPTLRRRDEPDTGDPDASDEPDTPETDPGAFLESPAELRTLIPLQDGDIFSTAKIRQGLVNLKDLYGSKGYIDFTAAPQTDVDLVNQTVSLLLELNSQERYRVGVVEILGGDSEMDRSLRSTLQAGAIFNSQAVDDFFRANQGSLSPGGPTRRVNLVRDTVLHTVNLQIDLRPCPDLGSWGAPR